MKKTLITLMTAAVVTAPLVVSAWCVIGLGTTCTVPKTEIKQTSNQVNTVDQKVSNTVKQGDVTSSVSQGSVSSSVTVPDKITVANFTELTQQMMDTQQALKVLGGQFLEQAKSTEQFWEGTAKSPPTIPIANGTPTPLIIQATQNDPPLNINIGQTKPPFTVQMDAQDKQDLERMFLNLTQAISSLHIDSTYNAGTTTVNVAAASTTNQVLQLSPTVTLDATSTAALLALASSTNMSFNPGGGSGSTLTNSITQANSFAIGDMVYYNGTTWVLASAAAPASAETLGMVTSASGTAFTYATSGLVSGLSGLTAGQVYYLSTVGTSGNTFTATEPTAVSSISKPIFVALSATTANLDIYRGTPAQGQTAVVQHGTTPLGANVSTFGTTSYSNVTGMTMTIPSAGTYRIGYSVQVIPTTAGATASFQLFNSTASAAIASTVQAISITGATPLSPLTNEVEITVTQATTITLQGKVSSGTMNILGSDVTNGSTNMWYVQIGAAPVPMDLVGEYGSFSPTSGVTAATGGATFTDFSTNQQFTIPTAGTWRINYNISIANNGAGLRSGIHLVDVTGGNTVVPGSYSQSVPGAANVGDTLSNTVTVTTTGANVYKLQGTTNSSDTITIINNPTSNNLGGESLVSYHKISGFIPTSGQTVDFAQYTRTAVQTITAPADITGWTLQSGNISTDGTSFTLIAGKTYKIEANLDFGNFSASDTTNFSWVDSSNTVITGGQQITPSASAAVTGVLGIGQSVNLIYTPSTNTTIKLRAITGSAGSTTVNVGSVVHITQLGSSAVISNIGSITMQAISTTAQSIPNNTNTTLITGWSTNIDTASGFNTGTGLYTVPTTGYYQVSGNVVWASNATGARITGFVVNGTVFHGVQQLNPGATGVTFNSSSALIKLSAGDTVGLNSFQTSGGALSTSPAAATPQEFGVTYMHN